MNGCDAHGVFLGEIRNNRRNGIDSCAVMATAYDIFQKAL